MGVAAHESIIIGLFGDDLPQAPPAGSGWTSTPRLPEGDHPGAKLTWGIRNHLDQAKLTDRVLLPGPDG